MIDRRFNSLAPWDNSRGDRYSLELEIISVDIDVEGNGHGFPSIEILKTNIIDHKTNKRIEGIVGNNFSSYVRDYDFSVLLREYNAGQKQFSIPDDFGELHGKLFKDFLKSDTYKENFSKLPVVCLSVSDTKTYHRTENQHPVHRARQRLPQLGPPSGNATALSAVEPCKRGECGKLPVCKGASAGTTASPETT